MSLIRITAALATLCLMISCQQERPRGDDDDAATVLARGVDIESITFNQGVEITLMEDGEEVESRNAPVVEGRDGLLRVYLERQDDFEERDIRVVLELREGDSPEPVEIEVDEDSKSRKLSSTANFFLDEIPSNLEFRVRLEEIDEEVDAAGDDNESEWPGGESWTDLNPRNPRGPLKVVLLPIRYNGDSSGRLPETGAGQLELFENAMLQRYPVADVEITVGTGINWTTPILPNGTGWSELLDTVMNRRWNDNPGRDVYYYGLFSPAPSLASFCSQGCVAGLSPLAENAEDDWGRASIGLGFPGEGSANTMAHEIGHAHGRAHAPCGLFGQASDPGYPHDGASVGVWGYDILDQSLRDPDEYFDFMAYCEPTWVSDYTYDELFDRVRSVNNLGSARAAEDQHSWVVLSLDGQGGVRKSGTLRRAVPPGGTARTVRLLDNQGQEIGTTEGYFTPLNHLSGGHLLLPEPGENVSALKLEDGSIVSTL